MEGGRSRELFAALALFPSIYLLCQIASHKPKLLPHAPTGDLRPWQPSQSAAPWGQLKAVLARLRLAASNQSVRGLPWKEGHAWLRELPRLPMSAQRGVQVAQREAARGSEWTRADWQLFSERLSSVSLTTALSLCTSGPALMGLSPSNCPTGDAENDRHILSLKRTDNAEGQTRIFRHRATKKSPLCTIFLCTQILCTYHVGDCVSWISQRQTELSSHQKSTAISNTIQWW